MICIVLAAGYATRLYPLTENFPKPLLEVRGKPILDWLLDDIDSAQKVSRYVVVSNHKFVSRFEKWADAKGLTAQSSKEASDKGLLVQSSIDESAKGLTASSTKPLSAPITVLDDGSTSNETRLGAVRDIQFAIESLKLDDDLLVIAGDNVLDFSLTRFMRYAKAHNAPCVMRYYEESVDKLRKTGVAEVDETDCITRMEEKPVEPFAHWCTPPFYYYPKDALHYVAAAIVSGCNTDAPGSFIVWLSQQMPVYAMEMPGKRYDIGNLQSYNLVQEMYQGITK
jgi:glucose-1-phosphate thymidylyltransferase